MRVTKSATDFDKFSDNGKFTDKRCIIADRWFGYVKTDSTISKLGHQDMMMVKKDHSRRLKRFWNKLLRITKK